MNGRSLVAVVVALCAAVGGCASQTAPPTAPVTADTSASADQDAVGSTPQTMSSKADGELPTPFSAAQIREAWVEGLTLRVQITTPKGSQHQRWRVLKADMDGCEIEYTTLDDSGEPAAAPTRSAATWTELRDHAKFDAATATRDHQRRVTPVGEFEGWVYVVRDEGAGTTSEFFFATSLPGAPLVMQVRQGDTVLTEMVQLERVSPN